MAQLTEYIKSGSRLPGLDAPMERLVIGLPGTPTQLLIYRGRIYIYDSDGQTLIDGGYISARAFGAATVTADKIALSSQKYINTILFTPTDENTCSWNAGNIIFSDGTVVTVYVGNTGNIGDISYVYYDGSSPSLHTTPHISSATGGSNIPLAIVEPVSAGKCLAYPFLAIGTTIDGDKITTGKIMSANSGTYFDLSNNRIQVNDPQSDRVVIGKMNNGSHGIKVSLPGYTADVDDNVNNYALWATSDDEVDNVLIKEKVRGSVSVGGDNTEYVAHGLGYIPFVLVFVEDSADTYIKCYGWDMSQYGLFYDVDETYLRLGNETGDTKTFKYYIFYDRVSSGIYEEIYVYDGSVATDEVSL
jgi:hypothetical protein